MANQYTATPDPLERFMEKVFKTKSCWIWLGCINNHGYGKLMLGGIQHKSHRWIYEYYNGPLGNFACMHKCNNPACVNPDHLEAGTLKENSIYCVKSNRHFQATKTHCKNGHEFTEANTILRHSVKGRHCAECHKINHPKRLPILHLK